MSTDNRTSAQAQARRIAVLEARLAASNRKLAKAQQSAKYWKTKYETLANSRLGRLTRKFWELKSRFATAESAKRTIRNALKKVPGLRPAVRFVRHLLKQDIGSQKPSIPKRKWRDLPVVAVIIPTYKPNSYLGECIKSVLKQRYPRRKIVIRLAVNGANEEYYRQLCKKYGFRRGFDVVYAPIAGAQAGRAAALERTSEECLCFLDDDDLLARDFLVNLACHIVGDVQIAATGNVDFDEDTGTENTRTYINLCLLQAGEGLHSDLLKLQNLFVTLWGKVIRTELLRDTFDPKYFSVKSADDVIYWCSCFDRLKGRVYVSPPKNELFYRRRLSSGSVTRPDPARQFVFFGQERVDAINILTDIFFSPCSERCRDFIIGKINAQVWIMHNYYKDLSPEDKQRYLEEVVFPAPSPLMNKSSFAQKEGIAFCQLFSPYICASSYVSPRRLAEIEGLEGQSINWKVICWELDNCRKRDEKYFKYYARARFGERVLLKGPGSFGEQFQEAWALQAFEKVKSLSCDYIYSRSMWPSTHHAAYLYKKAHPEVKWYAEFGDPLYTDTTGELRPPTKHYEGEKEHLNHYWRDLENMAYELADVVIFTNANQRDYMLKTSPDVQRFPDLLSRSLILPQPAIDRRYCLLEEADFHPADGYINIGYFGSFYAYRNESDLFRLLKNDKVFLHIFTYKTFVSITEKAPEYADRVKVYPLVPYLKMLNICTKMDYLLISDMVFPGDINPFLPSKLADYRSAGVPVLALVHGNSPLSHLELPNLIKIEEDDGSIIASLKKRN